MGEYLKWHVPFDDELARQERENALNFEPEPGLVTYRTLFSKERLDSLASFWVEEYGGEGKEFTYEQEQALVIQIQDGQAAQNAVAAGEADGSADVLDAIRLGQRAEQAMFEVNLRFAFMYARESVGIKHPGARARSMIARRALQALDEAAEAGSDDKPADPSRRKRGVKRHFGTYRPLSSSRSPYASLEDRYNMAAIGLLDAVRKATPGNKAKFTTYAAWRIQAHIDRGVLSSEGNGLRMSHGDRAKVMAYFGDHPSVGSDHRPPQDVDELLRMSDPVEWPGDYDAEREDSLAEINDPWHQDDIPHGLAEVWDDQDDHAEFEIALGLARYALDNVLKTIPEREATVVMLRSGLLACDCHPEPQPHTLKEIGRILGLTTERIRQIEAKTLSRLRNPMRTVDTRGAVEWLSEADQLPYGTLWRGGPTLEGGSIKLPDGQGAHLPDPEYPQDLSNALPSWSDEQWAVIRERLDWEKRMREREPWQAYPDEPWHMPPREVERPATWAEANDVHQLLSHLPSYIFSKGFVDLTGAPYPTSAMAAVRERLGKAQLTASQISRIWDEFMEITYPRLNENLEGDFAPDRIGQLFSQLIAENINDNDHTVKLVIQPEAAGQIGYMACRLGLGRVEIYGDTGDHTAAWNRGYSVVRVNGRVGNYAGSMMTGSASLFVTHQAGYALGVGAEGEAEISVERAASIGTFREDARVIERQPRPKTSRSKLDF